MAGSFRFDNKSTNTNSMEFKKLKSRSIDPLHLLTCSKNLSVMNRGETRALIRVEGCIFIYSCSARRISFEINPNNN